MGELLDKVKKNLETNNSTSKNSGLLDRVRANRRTQIIQKNIDRFTDGYNSSLSDLNNNFNTYSNQSGYENRVSNAKEISQMGDTIKMYVNSLDGYENKSSMLDQVNKIQKNIAIQNEYRETLGKFMAQFDNEFEFDSYKAYSDKSKDEISATINALNERLGEALSDEEKENINSRKDWLENWYISQEDWLTSSDADALKEQISNLDPTSASYEAQKSTLEKMYNVARYKQLDEEGKLYDTYGSALVNTVGDSMYQAGPEALVTAIDAVAGTPMRWIEKTWNKYLGDELIPIDLPGEQLGQFSDMVTEQGELAREIQSYSIQKYDSDLEKLGLKLASIVGSMAPAAITAVITQGASIGGTASALTTSSNTTGQLLSEYVKSLAKNPQYWTSFASTLGNTYTSAIEEGASYEEALASGLWNATLSSAVEVGGGIEGMKNSGFKDFIKSAFEEGKEEVIQGIIENITKKAMYDNDRALYSDTDENAIINPSRIGEEFAGGFIGGGLFSGVNAGIQSTLNAYNTAVNNSNTGRYIIENYGNEGVEEIIRQSQLFGSDTEVYKLGQKLSEQVAKGDINETLLGKVSSAIEVEFRNEALVNTKKALTDSGMNESDIRKYMDIAVKTISGQNLSNEEVNIVRGNNTVSQIFTENLGSTTGYIAEQSSYSNEYGVRETSSAAQGEPLKETTTNLHTVSKTAVNEANTEPDINSYDAVLKSTEEDVSIKRFDTTGDDIKLVLNDNSVVAAKELILSDDVKKIIAFARNYPVETANTMLHAYKAYSIASDSGTALLFARSFNQMYKYGKTGSMTFDEAMEYMIKDIPQTIYELAYNRGQQDHKADVEEKQKIADSKKTGEIRQGSVGSISESDAKKYKVSTVDMEVLSDKQKDAADVMEVISKALGINTYFFSDEGAGKIHGIYKDGNIYLNINAGHYHEQAILRTAAHELTHHIQSVSPKLYDDLKTYIISKYHENDTTSFDALVKDKMDSLNLTEEKAIDEVIADSCEMMLQDGSAVTELVNNNKSLWEHIKAVITTIVVKLKNAFKGISESSPAAVELKNAISDWTEIQKMWNEALVESKISNLNDLKEEKYSVDYTTDNIQNVNLYENVEYSSRTTQVIKDMPDKERAKILSSKTINVPVCKNVDVNTINAQELYSEGITAINEAFKSIFDEKKIFVDYYNDDTKKNVFFSKTNMNESLHKMQITENNIINMYKAFSMLKDIVKNAKLIEIHDDIYSVNSEGSNIKNVYTLLGGFYDKKIVPVELLVKEYRDKTKSGLYVVLTIKETEAEVVKAPNDKDTEELTSIPASVTFNVADIIKNINPDDGEFLKYCPDPLLSETQLNSKKEAIEKRNKRIEQKIEDRKRKKLKTHNFEGAFSQEKNSLSPRSILASTLMDATVNAEEKEHLKKYQEAIASIEDKETRINITKNAIRTAIFERESGLTVSMESINNMKKAVKNLERSVDYWDKKLLELEATAPLKNLMERQRKKLSQKYMEEARTRLNDSRDRFYASNRREQIKKNANTLISWIERPTNNNYIPDVLKKPVIEFLTSIDFVSSKASPTSNTTKEWVDKMLNLRHMITDIELDSFDENEIKAQAFVGAIDPELKSNITDFIRNNKGTKLSDLSPTEVENLHRIIVALKSAVTNANKFYQNQMSASVEQIGNRTLTDLGHLKDKTNYKMLKVADELLNVDMLDARSYFSSMGEAGLSIYNELREGFNKRVFSLREADKYMQENLLPGKTDKEKKRILSEWTGRKAKVHEFKVTDAFGNDMTVKITTGQLMNLYCLSKREQALNHITVGGIRIRPALNSKVQGNVVGIHLNKITLNSWLENLTTEEKQAADMMQNYLSSTVSGWGNEVSQAMYGYDKFTEKSYWPIETDNNTHASNDKNAGNTSLYQIKNMGMTKPLTAKANNPIMIGDIFDVFTKHVTDMANYRGYVIPLLDAMKWYNFGDMYQIQSGEDSQGEFVSVKQQIERVYGTKAKQYFIKLMQDINGSDASDKSITEKLVGGYKSAAVGGNLRVTLQQPMAYMRAAAVIDPKYLVKALGQKPAVEEMQKYSAIAIWKSYGYYDTGIGQSLKKIITGIDGTLENIKDKSMWLAGKADDITWGTIWNACKEEVKDTNPESVGTDAFMKLVTKRFDEVIDRTQVVDTVLHRTQIMRSKNAYNQMATSFMSEPMKSFNLLRNAIVEMIHNKDSASMRKLARTISAWLVSSFCTAASAAVVDMFRNAGKDDDKDKNAWERYLDALKENTIDNVNPLNMIPFIKEIPSMIDGYTPSRMDMEGISSLVNLGKTLSKLLKGDTGNKNAYYYIRLFAKTCSQLTGVPAYNIMRDLEGIWNSVKGTPKITTTKDTVTISSISQSAADAYLNGEDAADELKRLEDEIAREYPAYTKDKVHEVALSKIKSNITSEYKEKYIKGSSADKQDIISSMYSTGLYDNYEDVKSTCRSWEVSYWKEMYIKASSGADRAEYRRKLYATGKWKTLSDLDKDIKKWISVE